MNLLSATFKRGERRVILAAAVAALSLGLLASLTGASAASAAKTSSNVGYVYDFGQGVNDPEEGFECEASGSYPNCASSIFRNALTGTDPGASYTTADATKTVSLTNVPVSSIDAKGEPALAPFDTLILYEVCDIGAHPATITAINTFLSNGGKVMIWDADRCAPGTGGLADYSKFLFPFTTSSPGPKGEEGSYTHIVPSTLTTGLTLGVQEIDTMGDANTFKSFSGFWCGSITGTNGEGENGFVQATARTTSGGLAIYEGEDNWFLFEANAHDRMVFDKMLEQNWAPDGLPCSHPASGIKLEPSTQTQPVGGSATVTATVENLEDEPVEGVEVTIEVTGGPDAGQKTIGTTNASGQLSFTYPDTGGVGTDSLVASFIDIESNKHESPTAQVIWEPTPTTLSTSLSGEGATGEEITVFEGTAVTDSATLGGANAATATGEVEYNVYSDSGCTSLVASAGAVGVTGGVVPASNPETLPHGTYYWQASYGGDASNKGSSSKCGAEKLVVEEPKPTTLTTSLSGDGQLGGMITVLEGSAVTDTATLSGEHASKATGKVTYKLYSDDECKDLVASAGEVEVTGGVVPASNPETLPPGVEGVYYWEASYSGDRGNLPSSSECGSETVLIYGTAKGGNFVIGNNNAAIGTNVTFWGAQWWKLNSLSGGSAPAAFKGFEDNPATAVCGKSWTTDPGNSTPPPAGPLPAYMAVIVSSKVSKSGSAISGDTVHVVVVKTNPGYASDPGHAGTGVVVATIC